MQLCMPNFLASQLEPAISLVLEESLCPTLQMTDHRRFPLEFRVADQTSGKKGTIKVAMHNHSILIFNSSTLPLLSPTSRRKNELCGPHAHPWMHVRVLQ